MPARWTGAAARSRVEARVGEHGVQPAPIAGERLAGDQAFGRQPVDQAGQPGSRQQHPLGQLSHPQSVIGRLGQLQQDVVPAQRHAGRLEQITLEPPTISACVRRYARQTPTRQSLARNGDSSVTASDPRADPGRRARRTIAR